jgi:hypothetical protein
MESSIDGTGGSPQAQWIRNGLKAAESHVRRLRKAPDLARECEQVAAEYPDFLAT